MTINIILVTHGNIGKTLLQTTTNTLGKLPLPTTAISVPSTCNTDAICQQIESLIQQLHADGILILTDLYGATPCNIVTRLPKHYPLRVVSGANLPMLLRIMNYANLPLEALTEKAISGGKDGIVDCATLSH